MKREFIVGILNGLGITDEDSVKAAVSKIIDENGNDIQAAKAGVAAKDTEILSLREQIATRDKDIKDLQDKAKGNEGVSQQLADLQSKYEADTKALQKKLDDQAMDFAIEQTFAGVEFSSGLARKAAIADFRAKGYKLGEDGKFKEADAYFEQLRKDEPGAFKVKGGGNDDDGQDEQFTGGFPGADDGGNGGQNQGGGRGPMFTKQMNNGGGSSQGGNQGATIPMNFHYVRKPPESK